MGKRNRKLIKERFSWNVIWKKSVDVHDEVKLSRKTKYAMLVFLVIINIVLRLPITPHGHQNDSFHIQAYANFISTNGYADWILKPLSFFGWYPCSYPSGEPFFISSFFQCTGIEMEGLIWLVATFIGALGVFASYLMAKELKEDFLFAFSVAFVYSLSREYIDWTSWNVSSRGLFMAILPLLIWSLIRCYNKKGDRLKYLLMAIGLLTILATIHRMILFTLLIIITFCTTTFLHVVGKKIEIPQITPKVGIILFFALFIPLLLLPSTPLGLYHDIEEFEAGHEYGYFFHGSGPLPIFLNVSAEYAVAIGIFTLLAPIGLIVLLLKKQKTFSDVFLLALILFFAPFLADPIYMKFFVLFIFSLLIGFGLMEMLKMLGKVKKAKSVAPLIIISILLFSALVPYFVVVRPVPSLPYHTHHMNELTYTAALFIKEHGVELSRISASAPLLPRINAIAGPPYQHSKSDEIDRISSWSIEPISLSNFVSDFLKYKSLYVVKKPWYGHFEYFDCDNMYVKQVLSDKTHLVIEDNYLPANIPFYQSLRDTRPKIYDDGLESIWYLNYQD